MLFLLPDSPSPWQSSHTCFRPGFTIPSPLGVCPLFLDFLQHLLMEEVLGLCVSHHTPWLLPFCLCPRVASQGHSPRSAKAAWVSGKLKMDVAGQLPLCSCSRLNLCLGAPAWLDDLGTWGSFQELTEVGLSAWWVSSLGDTSCCGLQGSQGAGIYRTASGPPCTKSVRWARRLEKVWGTLLAAAQLGWLLSSCSRQNM